MKPLIALSLIILFLACNKNEFDCRPEQVIFSMEGNSSIVVNDSILNDYEIIAGDNLVFHLHRIGAQCDKIFDDEWGEEFVFEISNGLTKFEAKDSEISSLLKGIYREYGAWVGYVDMNIDSGYVKGELIEQGIWQVNTEFRTTPPYGQIQSPRVIVFEGIAEVK